MIVEMMKIVMMSEYEDAVVCLDIYLIVLVMRLWFVVLLLVAVVFGYCCCCGVVVCVVMSDARLLVIVSLAVGFPVFSDGRGNL